ncbi:hypothetical protein O181_101305 [Austropuccinia psidii MF-1]|uniref:Uncharacterized protein n=1 Tax=Austropuccinia psidii MF-1 TaxID=1389203 RepID=A0A9Q3PHM2_9BASI|nr:hypothetical protein [Austropuccinia psidii MF-1]
MDKINQANLNITKCSTPFSHIISPFKPKEEITNPFITNLSHQANNQVLIKEEPQLKERPTFIGEGEYDHMSFIRTIDILQEDYPIQDELITSRLHSLFMRSEKRWYYGIRQTNEDHNDKEEESDSEKDTEESETSESDEINIINAQINNIDLIYEVLDVNSNLPQVGTSDTNLTNIQDAKLYRTKPEKEMGYIAGKSIISILMVGNQEGKVCLDTGVYCTCVGKSYLETTVPHWEGKLIPIQGVKFSSSSESLKPLGIIELTFILPHPYQCIRLKVECAVMENCTSNDFILGNDYLSIYGIDISNQKDRYFTIGENKRQKVCFLNNKRQITVVNNEEKSPQMEPLGAIIGDEVDIILNVEKYYPPLLRRPAYPVSPRAREALEVHIKELMDLGVLRKVGYNEQVEVTTPVIITWHDGKSRMVGDFRALQTYTIPDRCPIPRIHETLTKLSQAKFITSIDALNVRLSLCRSSN